MWALKGVHTLLLKVEKAGNDKHNMSYPLMPTCQHKFMNQSVGKTDKGIFIKVIFGVHFPTSWFAE